MRGEGIKPEDAVEYHVDNHRSRNLFEWEHIVFGTGTLLHGAYEALDFWDMLVFTGYVEVTLEA